MLKIGSNLLLEYLYGSFKSYVVLKKVAFLTLKIAKRISNLSLETFLFCFDF